MRDQVTARWSALQRLLQGYTAGQKAVLGVGGAALLLATFMLVRWISAPSYVPLFSDLSSADASAVIDELDSKGVAYEITDGGSTITVPRADVYSTRIALSGEGIPSGDDKGGYSILDEQDLSTSKFKEQTDYKRAMEGELTRTIEAIDGVRTAVVHLALPRKEVFSDEQAPATASVLVSTTAGNTLSGEQVQAIVHLVSSSVEGLPADQVTVADASGRVLSVAGDGGGAAGSRQQQTEDYQDAMAKRITTMLDRVVGAGRSTVRVTADLDFDQAVTESTRYTSDPQKQPLSTSRSTEKYQGSGTGGAGSTGVVGPDGQMDTTAGGGAGGDNSYEKEQVTSDNAVDRTVEKRQAAPGSVASLHIGVALDDATLEGTTPQQIQGLVEAAAGIDPRRGDTVEVTAMPFDRTAEEAAAKELAAAESAASRAAWLDRGRTIALVLLLVAAVVWAVRRSRRQQEERLEATQLVVEQLRQDGARARAVEAAAPTALVELERTQADDVRDEIADLVERQPEDVAALLRGWLAERP
jgi:flagellar M-ring protein FliF